MSHATHQPAPGPPAPASEAPSPPAGGWLILSHAWARLNSAIILTDEQIAGCAPTMGAARRLLTSLNTPGNGRHWSVRWEAPDAAP